MEEGRDEKGKKKSEEKERKREDEWSTERKRKKLSKKSSDSTSSGSLSHIKPKQQSTPVEEKSNIEIIDEIDYDSQTEKKRKVKISPIVIKENIFYEMERDTKLPDIQRFDEELEINENIVLDDFMRKSSFGSDLLSVESKLPQVIHESG